MVGVEVQGPYKEYIAGGVLPLDYMQHDDPPHSSPFYILLGRCMNLSHVFSSALTCHGRHALLVLQILTCTPIVGGYSVFKGMMHMSADGPTHSHTPSRPRFFFFFFVNSFY